MILKDINVIVIIAYLVLILPICAGTQNDMTKVQFSNQMLEEAVEGLLIHEGSDLTQFKKSRSVSLGENMYPKVTELNDANRFINVYDSHASQFKVSNKYVYFSAIRNPENTYAVFMERIAYKPIWNLWLVNLSDNSYTKLFDETTFPIENTAPLVFGWDDKGNLLADAFRIDWSLENNGLLSINTKTKVVSNYTVDANYIGRPLLSPDGKYLAYLATSDKKRDILHSPSNEVWLKELNTGYELNLRKGSSYSLIGYSGEIKTKQSLTNASINEQSSRKKSQPPSIKLPYPAGEAIYVTRHGMHDPPAGCWPGTGVHCYAPPNDNNKTHTTKVAIDWSNKGTCGNGSDTDQIAIHASTAGTVIHAEDLGTCGLTVKMSSVGDGTVVRYCHLSSIEAIAGQVWVQGGPIGKEGNTGSSTSEHLHQDFFDENEEPSTGFYAKYEDTGNSIPHYGYQYVSQNSQPIGFPCGAVLEDDLKKANSSCVDLDANCGSLQSTVNQNTITLSQLEITNVGLAGAIPYTIGFYLSPTNSLNDATILGFQNMYTLPGYTSATIQTESFNIPNVPDGNYYIITAVDVPNVVNDEYLGNNYCYGHGPLTIGNLPTCHDGVLNQGEEGIDCGGPCEACSNCIENWHVSYANLGGIYRANNTVSSDGSIANNTVGVDFRAGKKVDLLPGFTADASDGYTFTAKIEDCNSNLIQTEVPETELIYDISESQMSDKLLNDNSDLQPIEDYGGGFDINNYPNPFSAETTIDLSLHQADDVSIYVNDINGKIVKMIKEKMFMAEGRYQFTFDGSMHQVGIYYYTVIIGNEKQSRKMILIN